LALLCNGMIKFSFLQLCFTTVIASSFVFSLTPVMFEYTAELTYPIPENVTGGLLTTSYNFFGFIIFILCYIPGIGEIWVDWALFVTCLTGIPIVWLTKEKYLRSEMDSETSIAQENSSYDIPGSLVTEIATSQSNQTLS